jgi:AcrR family transcriptional regulator
MSPRPLDPNLRATLIEAAAKLVTETGPATLSTRRVAAAAGTSTMAVYTYFGGKDELVREIVRDGFARLQRLFNLVEPSADPVADMGLLGRVYRYNALTNRHVYGVMFGGSSLDGFALSDEDRQHGRYTLSSVVDCAQRCIESGRFREDDPGMVAHQMWLGVHGTATLELGGYLIAPYNADSCFEMQLVTMMIGSGDDPAMADDSVAASLAKFGAIQEELTAVQVPDDAGTS